MTTKDEVPAIPEDLKETYEDAQIGSACYGNSVTAAEYRQRMKLIERIAKLEAELRERTLSEERLRDRERDVCAAVTRCCDMKKINEIMQDTLKAREARAKGE
jgi:hypothetical protein